MVASQWLEPVARTLVGALGAGVVESALLAAAVFAMIRSSQNSSAASRHLLWSTALGVSGLLPLVSLTSSLGRIERRPASTAVLGSALAYDALALAWLVVALAGIAALLRGLYALRKMKREASALDESIVRRLRRWRQSARRGRPVALQVCDEVNVPVALGFRKPAILFPLEVVEREEIADLDQIALHEYAHLARYDDWTNLLQRLIQSIFWFNPIVALLGAQMALEREIACDDWVVARTGKPHRYATCLWRLVESLRLPPAGSVAPGAVGSPHQVATRIERLLNVRSAAPRYSQRGIMGLAGLSVALVAFEFERAPSIHPIASPAFAQARSVARTTPVASNGALLFGARAVKVLANRKRCRLACA